MATKKTWNTDKILSISAIFVSACALIVSVVQTRIMQIQQEKTVWPHVRWYIASGWGNDSIGHFKIKVVNKGVGPAIVKDVTIVLDGVKYGSDELRTVVEKINEQRLLGVSEAQFEQTVMLPNDEVITFELTNEKQAYKVAQKYISEYAAQNRIDIIIEYEDVYGNKFVSTGKTKF